MNAELQQFLEKHIRSECDLYVLLALLESEGRWWDAEGIASHIGKAAAEARPSLEFLTASNLLDIRISDRLRYRLRPGTIELEGSVHAFAAAYCASPASVLRWATSRTRRGLTDFANAFRLKR